MRIISSSPEISFDDVLILPDKSDFVTNDDEKETSLSARLTNKITLYAPIVSAPMPSISETDMATAIAESGGIGFIHCFQSFERQLEQVDEVSKKGLKVAASVSDLSKDGVKHVGNLLKAGVTLVGVETEHAHNVQTIKFIRKLKRSYKEVQISAALVVTGKATSDLIKAGADNIRVGIGGGSHCTTRQVCGIGRPQLSAVKECFEVARKYNVPIMSDTGIRYPGNIPKALVFGADTVMIGGLFAGTDESPGEIVIKEGKKYKYSYGMCTEEAMVKDQKLSRRQIKKTIRSKARSILGFKPKIVKSQRFQEGVGGLIPYRGSVIPILNNLKQAVQRSMWYLGARDISELRKRAKVVIVSPNTQLKPTIGQNES